MAVSTDSNTICSCRDLQAMCKPGSGKLLVRSASLSASCVPDFAVRTDERPTKSKSGRTHCVPNPLQATIQLPQLGIRSLQTAGTHRHSRPACMQVAGFLAFFTCSFIPVIAYPAYKASTADPNKESRGSEAGFSKSGMWGQIDK